jgi:GNAT superfamily N-acetyltransferase
VRVEWARPATDADVDAIALLMEGAAVELASERGGPLWLELHGRMAPVEESIRADLGDPSTTVFVGGIDDVVLGWSTISVQAMRTTPAIAALREIYVDPDARGVGIGEAMMDCAIDWSTERGCRGIDSAVLPGMRESKNFFERFGLVARSIQVHRALSRP